MNIQDHAKSLGSEVDALELTAPTATQKAALDASHDPSETNAFATLEDVATSSAAGSAGVFYFCDDDAPQYSVTYPWHELEPEPDAQPVAEHSQTLTTTNQQYLLDQYCTDPLGLTRIPGGNWKLDIWCRISTATGQCFFDIQPCIVHADGTHTIIDASPSTGVTYLRTAEINNTVYGVVEALVSLAAVEGILETDALGVFVYGVKTSVGGTPVIYFSHDLVNGRLSSMSSPLVTPRPATYDEVIAGTSTSLRTFSVLRIWQAIAAKFTALGGVTAAATLTDTKIVVGAGTKAVKETGIAVSAADMVSGAGSLIVEKGASYGFALGDEGKTFKATAGSLTFTVPARASVAFASGMWFNVDASLYEVTIAVTSDTLISDGSKTKVKVGTIGTIFISSATADTLIGSLA